MSSVPSLFTPRQLRRLALAFDQISGQQHYSAAEFAEWACRELAVTAKPEPGGADEARGAESPEEAGRQIHAAAGADRAGGGAARAQLAP